MKKIYATAGQICSVAILPPSHALAAAGQQSEQLDNVLHSRDPANYAYATKFGSLRFVQENGQPGKPVKAITLDGRTPVSSVGLTTAQGAPLSLMSEIMTAYRPRHDECFQFRICSTPCEI